MLLQTELLFLFLPEGKYKSKKKKKRENTKKQINESYRIKAYFKVS